MRIVLALGGNALGNTPLEQLELVKQTAHSIADVVQNGHEVVIVHGNGPQVGMINNAFETSHKYNEKSPLMPLPECGAMSQGYIGFHLQNAIKNALRLRKIDKDVVTLVTQTIVDAEDEAFSNPTKPIGAFYSKEEALKIANEKNVSIKEDSGRGYRVVVASPKPIDFVERNSIKQLVKSGTIVIASGGGGIPVIDKSGEFQGVPAVIDKDLSSSKLATLLGADVFVVLTAVDNVMINFGTPKQMIIDKMSSLLAKQYIKSGEFGEGSMLPKVAAAIDFVEKNKNVQAVIASLENALDAINGKSGTIIYKE